MSVERHSYLEGIVMAFNGAKYDPIVAHQVMWMAEHHVQLVERIDWPSGIRYVKVSYMGQEYAENASTVGEALDKLFSRMGLGGLVYAMWCLEHAMWLLSKRINHDRA